MTELEILAQFKTAYLSLEDIEENADQLEPFDNMELWQAMDILNKQYEKIFQKIERLNNESLYYKKDIKIGNSIYVDYTLEDTEDKESITYTDMDNEEKWWGNYEFLIK